MYRLCEKQGEVMLKRLRATFIYICLSFDCGLSCCGRPDGASQQGPQQSDKMPKICHTVRLNGGLIFRFYRMGTLMNECVLKCRRIIRRTLYFMRGTVIFRDKLNSGSTVAPPNKFDGYWMIRVCTLHVIDRTTIENISRKQLHSLYTCCG